MNRERFEFLAEAYGGDPALWPAETRDAAAELIAGGLAFARTTLGRAQALDALLGSHVVATPSSALIGRILANAPSPRRRGSWLNWLAPVGLSAGLMAAGAAGVMLGVQLSPDASYDVEALITLVGDGGSSLYAQDDA